ncbi:MAG: hypothetical protein KDM63_16540, partial [Verrucomicrobiae bacterium]|nr:hypothetical protein [Verrucomicrobiae bacterium]
MTDQRATRVDDETDEIIWKKPTSLGKATADAIVLALLLAGTNWLIDKADPGWQRLNPTPWLLLPLFLGGRYGIGGGLTGALLAIGGVLGLQFFSGDRTPVELLRAKPF